MFKKINYHNQKILIKEFVDRATDLFILPMNIFVPLVNKSRKLILVITMTLFLFTLTPFIFTQFVTSNFRLIVALISLFILLISTSKITFSHFILFILVLLWGVSFILVSEQVNLDDTRHIILTICSIYMFAIMLHRALLFNHELKKLVVKYYIIITGILAGCSILSVIYYVLFGTYFFMDINGSVNYNYLTTPFGVLIEKNFFGLHVVRSCHYCVEPVFSSVLFAGNLFIISEDIRSRKSYTILNLVAGVLLFSFAYYLFFAYFYLLLQKKNIKIIYPIFFICLLIAIVQNTTILGASSLSVRFDSIYHFLNDTRLWSGFEWIFGSKFAVTHTLVNTSYDGFVQIIWNYGILGLILYFIIIFVISRKNYIILGAMLITSMVLDPSICPLYYLMTVVFGVILSDKNFVSSFHFIRKKNVISESYAT